MLGLFRAKSQTSKKRPVSELTKIKEHDDHRDNGATVVPSSDLNIARFSKYFPARAYYKHKGD
jgi:hypothetical protein